MGLTLLVISLLVSGCDHGLAPPDIPPTGSIIGQVRYTGEWPGENDVRDLRFVAMRFVPTDTADFLQLNRMAISPRLAYGVASDSFSLMDIETGTFFYSGVAQQFSENILSWKPIGLYAEQGGIFQVKSGETTRISIQVDFRNPPPFPPPGVSRQ